MSRRRDEAKPTSDAIDEHSDEEKSLSDAITERVCAMFGKNDRKIAASLIADEIVRPPKSKMSAAETSKWEDAVRRTVNNYRHRIVDSWKNEPLPKPGDPAEARKFVAKCQTRIEELDDIVENKLTKSTFRAAAFAEIRHLETLIAQTLRVDTGGRRRLEDDGDDESPQSKLPFVGVVVDMRNVSEETRREIEREQKQRGGAASAPGVVAPRAASSRRKGPKVQAER
jgi:hypothetical protein